MGIYAIGIIGRKSWEATNSQSMCTEFCAVNFTDDVAWGYHAHMWPSKWMTTAEVKINAQQAFRLESNPKRQIAIILIKYLLALSLVIWEIKLNHWIILMMLATTNMVVCLCENSTCSGVLVIRCCSKSSLTSLAPIIMQEWWKVKLCFICCTSLLK